MLQSIDNAIIDTFYLIYGVNLVDQIITTTSCGNNNSNDETPVLKISFHKIISGYVVANNREASDFTSVLLTMVDPLYKPYIDASVNKQIQNFRMLHCAKPASNPRYKSLLSPDYVEYHQTVISSTVGCILLPEKANKLPAQAKSLPTGGLTSDDMEIIQELA